jgi:hypothetical protein
VLVGKNQIKTNSLEQKRQRFSNSLEDEVTELMNVSIKSPENEHDSIVHL